MIRKFFSLSIFITTVLIACFGQGIIGHSDIARLATYINNEGGPQAKAVLTKTDKVLLHYNKQ